MNVKNRRHTTNECERSSTHGEFISSIWPPFALFTSTCSKYGWLNSGASALVIRHHLLKVRIFYGTSFLFAKDKKKLKVTPPHLFLKKVPKKHIIIFGP